MITHYQDSFTGQPFSVIVFRTDSLKLDSKYHADSKRISQSSLSEKSYPHKACISQVPLRLLIKIGGQKDGLGISIAGGRGSLPYMENDESPSRSRRKKTFPQNDDGTTIFDYRVGTNEGIFISRVSRGGPAEKAGLHIGDRVLEVNGQDMQGVSHHEAVSTMRQAGSCIKIKVLRQRLEPTENQATQEPEHSKTGRLIGEHHCSIASRIEAVVCNGKGLSDLAHGTTSGKDWHTFLKNTNLQLGQQTMTIPRIILTHPSTSDEDVDGVTLSDLDEINNPDNHIYSDLNSAFYPR